MDREEGLLRRYATQGSQAAFAELVDRYMDFVYSVCRRKMGDPQLAEDVTQAVFLLLAEKAPTIKPGTSVAGWLFRAAELTCRNHIRGEARRRHYEQMAIREIEHAGEAVASGPDPDSLLLGLDDALGRLATTDRDAVLLRYVDGLSLDEVGVALGVSAAAAHKRISRAIERLRRHLAPAGGALTVAAVALLLSDRMVEAAPVGLAQTLQAIPIGGGEIAGSAAAPPAQRYGPRPLSIGAGAAGIVLVAALAWAHPHIAGFGAHAAAVPSPVPTFHISGRVLDAAGRPAAGADVSLVRTLPTGFGAVYATAKTDAAGVYGLDIPQQKAMWTVLADDGHGIGFGSYNADCRILPSTTVRLHVVDQSGNPVAGVRLEPAGFTVASHGLANRVAFQSGAPARLVAMSDGNGIAVFHGVPVADTMAFQTLNSRYARVPYGAQGLPVSADAASNDFLVRVAPAAGIEGTVRYADGRPAPEGVRVGAQAPDGIHGGEAYTDANGRYALSQLAAGQYTVAVDEDSPPLARQWTAVARENVNAAAQQTRSGQDLMLERGVVVHGVVTGAVSGRRLAGIPIGVYSAAHPRGTAWVGGAETAADGAYSVRVPPGTAFVYDMMALQATARTIPVGGSGATVDMVVPGR